MSISQSAHLTCVAVSWQKLPWSNERRGREVKRDDASIKQGAGFFLFSFLSYVCIYVLRGVERLAHRLEAARPSLARRLRGLPAQQRRVVDLDLRRVDVSDQAVGGLRVDADGLSFPEVVRRMGWN